MPERVKRIASGWKKTAYLFAPVTMMMGRAGPLGVDIMREYVKVAGASSRPSSSGTTSHVQINLATFTVVTYQYFQLAKSRGH